MQRRSGQVPPHLADLPVVAEQADVADLDSLRAIGERHEITGIVHLAGYPAPRGTVGGIEATQGLLDGLLNIARVAAEWGVRRVSLASTLGVYGGIAHSGPLTEDLPVLLTAPHPIPRSKKIAELLGEQLGEATGAEFISLRISGTWGPLGHEDPFFAAPALIHAAASGKPLDLSGLLIPPHMGDGLDLCYVKDTGRAIALVQLAGHLQYRTYNIASGRVTTNAEVIAAIREAVPGVRLHGFGIKICGLGKYGSLLHSCDSLAWSMAARRQPALPGCAGHHSCANCARFAFRWRERVLAVRVYRLGGWSRSCSAPGWWASAARVWACPRA